MNNIIRRSWNMYSMVNIEDLRGSAFQAEAGGHTFEITGLDENGNATTLSGTVAGIFIRPDNTDVAITGSVSNGKVYVTLTDECYGYPGTFGLTIFLTSGGQKVAIYAAIGSVHRTTSGSVSPETAADVVDLINAIETAVASIPQDYTTLWNVVLSGANHKYGFVTSNLYAYKYAFIAGHTYSIRILTDSVGSWYTNMSINMSATNADWISTFDGDDITESITASTRTITQLGEVDVIYKCGVTSQYIAYYLGSNSVIPHRIYIEDVTDIGIEPDDVKIPLNINGAYSAGFMSIPLLKDIEYKIVITNKDSSADFPFELTGTNSYTITTGSDIERVFGGVVSKGATNAVFKYKMNNAYNMVVINATAATEAKLGISVYCNKYDFIEKYSDDTFQYYKVLGSKRVIGTEKRDISNAFYTIEGINFEAGNQYIIRFADGSDPAVDYTPSRVAFSTFDGTRSSYTFVEEGVFDVSDVNFGTDYSYIFTPQDDAESLMILLSGHTSSTIVDIYVYGYEREANGRMPFVVNPVFKKRDTSDPTVWDGRDGYFYCLGSPWTNTEYGLLRSADLVEWEDTGVYPFDSSVTSLFSTYDCGVWACHMLHLGDNWLLYIPLFSTTVGTAIAVCKSRNPFGKFTLVRMLTESSVTGIGDSIDPCVVIGEDNKVYMFFGSSQKVYRIQLTDDGLDVESGSTPVHVAGTNDTSDHRAKIFEGTYLYFRDGYWYMFVSSGEFNNYTYKLNVGRSATITGTFVDKDGNDLTSGLATPILSSAEGDMFNGPGHNGDIFVDRVGRTYMFYHCHDPATQYTFNYPPFTYLKSRMLFLQEIKWDSDGWCYFENSKPACIQATPVL